MDTAGRFLRVRSVVGRSTDLYRGVSTEPSTPRDPSPAVPLASLLEALRRLDGISVTHARKQLVLARGGDEEDLKIHVDVDPVTLPDLNFEGHPELAIRALHAWLPMFGAAELRDDDYTELVDSTEPVEDAVKRYHAKARADLAKIQARIGGLDGAVSDTDALPVRRSRRYATYAVIAVIAIVVPLAALWVFRTVTRRADVGATCTQSKQCESGECLSADPIEPSSYGDGSPMMRAHGAITRGVCTQPCRDDSECPTTMTCQSAQFDSVRGKPYEVKRCTPTAWITPSE